MDLIGRESLKTWSLIVTLFGDLDGEELTGAQIRDLLGHLGIKPDAIRVALHRLKSDGWIVSTHHGREAVYALSKTARRETVAASADVYRQKVKFPEGCRFYLLKEAAAPAGSVALTRELIVAPRDVASGLPDAVPLVAETGDIPVWVERRLVSEPFLETAEGLVAILQAAERAGGLPSERDRTAMRLLVLHHWRRLALRPGSWAHIGLLPEGSLARCHRLVTTFLKDSPPIRA
ncbi:hypothetical protein AAD018_005110 [Aestuariibius insulae]|uniref:hypothetical protein n=1 Tax=Aestuariibius insulae TaxID=2058287 RepID=UPI00398E7101